MIDRRRFLAAVGQGILGAVTAPAFAQVPQTQPQAYGLQLFTLFDVLDADAQVLQQEAGLRWTGGVDPYGAALLAGCDGTRRLGELLSVLALSAGISEDDAAEQVLPVVERLVHQGFLVP